MKLIHCADLHLDSQMAMFNTAEERAMRRNELLYNFKRMIDYALLHEVDGILIAGDLFDHDNVTKSCKQTVLDEMKRAQNITFFYLRGNHDRFFSWDENRLNLPENVIMFQDEFSYFQFGEVCIAGVEFSPENAAEIGKSLCLEKEKINIVMLHGQDRDYPCQEETYQIALSEFQHKNIDYLALGHIHQARSGELDARGVFVYSGCLEGRGYDECGEKGFQLLRIKHGKIDFEFIPFAKRCFHELVLDVKDFPTTKALLQEIYERSKDIKREDGIKAILTGEKRPEEMIPKKYIEEWLKDNFFMAKVLDQTKVVIFPEDYQYDVSLKGAFVRLCQKQEMDETMRKKVLQIGLKALDGEEF